jgi:hypothetical protein
MRQVHSEVSLRLAISGITPPMLSQDGGKFQIGFSGYVDNGPTPDSLPLGQEIVP